MSIIHYFNPGHENAVLNRLPSYTPPASLTTIMKELASLPAWYANPEDVVLVDNDFDISYYNELTDKGIELSKLLYNKDLLQYNKSLVCLWGIAPSGIRLFESYNKEYAIHLQIPQWYDKFIYLNSRMASRDTLAFVKENSKNFENIELPSFFSDIESIESYVQSKFVRLLAKSPYSSSGRGLLWLPMGGIMRSERQILNGMLNKQESVSVEIVYDKHIDFAMEFIIDNEGISTFVGYSLFTTNEKGAYTGNKLYSQVKIESILTNLVDESILEECRELLLESISDTYKSIYNGCIGVDMMIFKDSDGKYYLHPCVEVNMRYNMGYLAVRLHDKFISKSSEGEYKLDYDASGNTYIEHRRMMAEYPLQVEEGRVKSGYLSLCPVHKNTKYRAYILVEEL